MAEREEKIIKKGEKKEEKKPSLWQRMKKPLAAGLLGASLLLHPVKRVDAVGFAKARDPPLYAAELIEKDKDLKVGWKFLIRAYENGKGKINIDTELAIKYLDKAIEIFKKAYEKTGSTEALYLQVYAIYEKAGPQLTFEETEKICMEALEIIEKRLKEEPYDLLFNDLKHKIYHDLAVMYYDGYTLDPDYIRWHHIDFSKLEFYKQKAIEFAKKGRAFDQKMLKDYDKLKIITFSEAWKNEEEAKEAILALKQQHEKHDNELEKIEKESR